MNQFTPQYWIEKRSSLETKWEEAKDGMKTGGKIGAGIGALISVPSVLMRKDPVHMIGVPLFTAARTGLIGAGIGGVVNPIAKSVREDRNHE